MWENVCLPQEPDGPIRREALVEGFAVEKMREYGGTVFLCVSKEDWSRRNSFRQAAARLGLRALDGWELCGECSAEALAKRPGRNVLFVKPSMEQYLGEYLDACPAGERHLLLYTRRRGNGPSPAMSQLMAN